MTDSEGNPVSGAAVLLRTEDDMVLGRANTRGDGQYEIRAGVYLRDYEYIKDKEIYILEASVPGNTDYEPLEEELSFTGEDDIIRDIILFTYYYAGTICGKVCDAGGMPIAGAYLKARLERYSVDTETGDDGLYCLRSSFSSLDRLMTVAADGYASQERYARAGTTLNFYLELGGLISGHVRNIDGEGMKYVSVEIRSETSDYREIMYTDRYGFYRFEALSANDFYTIIANAYRYMPQSESQKRTGDEVDFTFGELSDTISGRLRDPCGRLSSDDVVVVIKIFEEGSEKRIGITDTDRWGYFEITGLTPDVKYQLRFEIFGTDTPIPPQWYREDYAALTRENAETCEAGTDEDMWFNNYCGD